MESLRITARVKLADRPIIWREVYTRDTAYFKQMYEDCVGPGSYFRFEGRDSDSGDEYFVVIAPAQMHDPEPKFFAGNRKLPAEWAASGKYFGQIKEAVEYASETWGVPVPKDVRLRYDSRDLHGLGDKMEAWRGTHHKDEVSEEFEHPLKKAGALHFLLREAMGARRRNLRQHDYFDVDDLDRAGRDQAIQNLSAQDGFPHRILDPITKTRRSPSDQEVADAMSVALPVARQANQWHRWRELAAARPNLEKVLDMARRDRERKRTQYIGKFGRQARVPGDLWKYFISVDPDPRHGAYQISIGPYLNTYFGQGINKFGVFVHKLNLASQEEINNAMRVMVEDYANTYGVELDPATDFKLPERDGDMYLDKTVEVNVSGREKLHDAVARITRTPLLGTRRWMTRAARNLERKQREWTQSQTETLQREYPNIDFAGLDAKSLDSLIRQMWKAYNHRKREDPEAVWQMGQPPPPPTVRWHERTMLGADRYTTLNQEPKYVLQTSPAEGSTTLSVGLKEGESRSRLEAGDRIRLTTVLASRNTNRSKTIYTVTAVGPVKQGGFSVQIEPPYAVDPACRGTGEGLPPSGPTGVEVQGDVAYDRERNIDWAKSDAMIAEELQARGEIVTEAWVRKERKSHKHVRFGFKDMQEAINWWRQNGFVGLPDQYGNLERNYTAADLAHMRGGLTGPLPSESTGGINLPPPVSGTPAREESSQEPSLFEKEKAAPAQEPGRKPAEPAPAGRKPKPVAPPEAASPEEPAEAAPEAAVEDKPSPAKPRGFKHERPVLWEAIRNLTKLSNSLQQRGFSVGSEEVQRILKRQQARHALDFEIEMRPADSSGS